jgi:hypothetical protein
VTLKHAHREGGQSAECREEGTIGRREGLALYLAP